MARDYSKPRQSFTALPAPRDHGDDARERVHVARVNHFRGRMRVAQRPAERDIHRAVGNERRAVVAASGDAELVGNLIGAREFFDFLDEIRAARYWNCPRRGSAKPLPISASPKRFDSSGESELTSVSTAKT